jgi:hypothetical protein
MLYQRQSSHKGVDEASGKKALLTAASLQSGEPNWIDSVL